MTQQCILFLTGLFGLGAVADGFAAEMDAATQPAFVKETIYSPYAAKVAKVIPSFAGDAVILEGGLEQGLRCGMVCRIHQDSQAIGELIIIESRNGCSAGLILELAQDAAIESGDVVRVKTIQNN